MKKLIYLITSALISLVSCKTVVPQQSVKTVVPEQSFNIGRGGGFTGKYDEYMVKSTGEVYNINNRQTPVLFETLGKETTKAIFDKFNKLNIISITFSKPGNMTSYISCEIEGKTYEIKWGDSRNLPPQIVQDFFNYAWSTIRPK